MGGSTLINPVAFFVSHITRLFIKRHDMTIDEFLALDAKKDILGYLKDGYEVFHLIGEEGVLDELDTYIGSDMSEHIKIDTNSYV